MVAKKKVAKKRVSPTEKKINALEEKIKDLERNRTIRGFTMALGFLVIAMVMLFGQNHSMKMNDMLFENQLNMANGLEFLADGSNQMVDEINGRFAEMDEIIFGLVAAASGNAEIFMNCTMGEENHPPEFDLIESIEAAEDKPA